MSNLPTIDILLATYNGEIYLQEQIESILAQTYPNINIIVSDDGSTDSTIKILEAYKHLPNFKVYYNSFGNSNENFGFLVNVSESEYIAFADQDDFWLPKKIEKCFNLLVKEDSLLVYSDLYITDDKLDIIDKLSNTTSIKKPYCGEFNIEILLLNSTPGCTILTKSDIAKSILPIGKIDVIHDWKLMISASLSGKISYVDEPLMYYRQHSNNQVGAGKTDFAFAIRQRKLVDEYIIDSFLDNNKIENLELYPVKKINFDFKLINLILKSNVTLFCKLVHLCYFCLNAIYLIIVKIYLVGKGK